MSRVKRIKEGARRFLSKQYEEFVPPKVKRIGTALKKREPGARQTLKTRGERGKEHLKSKVRELLSGKRKRRE